MVNKHNYLKAERLTKLLIYPSVVQKTKNPLLIYPYPVRNQQKYPTPALEARGFQCLIMNLLIVMHKTGRRESVATLDDLPENINRILDTTTSSNKYWHNHSSSQMMWFSGGDNSKRVETIVKEEDSLEDN